MKSFFGFQSFFFKAKIFFYVVMILLFYFFYGCGDSNPKQEKKYTDNQIRNIETKSAVIASSISSLPEIFLGKIKFDTKDACTTSVEVDGIHFGSGTGTNHMIYVYGTMQPAQYSIHATCAGVKSSTQDVLIANMDGIFSYQGEIEDYLDYLSPVIMSIHEEFLNSNNLLDVVILGGVDNLNLFKKNSIFELNENTIDEVFNSFDNWFKENKDSLKSKWSLFSEDELKAACILNVVSHMWHYGNFKRITRTGCVQVNEQIGADEADFIYAEYENETPIYWRTAIGMSGYLNSEIGCCTDHAFLTKALLEKAGYESRRILLPGHWISEVLIDGFWYTIDATSGVMVNASRDQMSDRAKRTAFLFVTPYMFFDLENYSAPTIYPWIPQLAMDAGLYDFKESDYTIVDGYYDDPNYANELAQLNGQ